MLPPGAQRSAAGSDRSQRSSAAKPASVARSPPLQHQRRRDWMPALAAAAVSAQHQPEKRHTPAMPLKQQAAALPLRAQLAATAGASTPASRQPVTPAASAATKSTRRSGSRRQRVNDAIPAGQSAPAAVQPDDAVDAEMPATQHPRGLPFAVACNRLKNLPRALVGFTAVHVLPGGHAGRQKPAPVSAPPSESRKAASRPLGRVKGVIRVGPVGGSAAGGLMLQLAQPAALPAHGYAGEEEHLVPLVAAIVPQIDLEGRVLYVQPPPGTMPPPPLSCSGFGACRRVCAF